MKIKKITRVPYKGKVHNFGTPPAHTYFANGVLVHNCYTNATGKGLHMTERQLETVILGFKEPPYQIAFGGGSPTSHPDLVSMLALTSELGVVPNYTTEGEGLTQEILDATRRYCGGVALTFHRRSHETEEQTRDRFVDRYEKLKGADIRQVNIHVIAGVRLLDDLAVLLTVAEALGPLNIVLLAYYPGVGRDDGSNLLPIRVFDEALPSMIRSLEASGCVVSYSQGLLPYFKSRPDLGKATHTHRMEGFMTAAIDVRGFIASSSFDRFTEDEAKKQNPLMSAFNTPSQVLWLTMPSAPLPKPNGECFYELGCGHVRTCGGSREDTLHSLCRYTSSSRQVVPNSSEDIRQENSNFFTNSTPGRSSDWWSFWNTRWNDADVNSGRATATVKVDQGLSSQVAAKFPGLTLESTVEDKEESGLEV